MSIKISTVNKIKKNIKHVDNLGLQRQTAFRHRRGSERKFIGLKMADGLVPIALVPQLSNSSTLPGEDELIMLF